MHAGVFAALDREPVAGKIFAPPKRVLAKKPKPTPKSVRFELIDTPASAKVPKPPKKSTLMSDKHTRAQDKFQGKKKLEDSPHLEGTRADSKDTRPRTVIAKPAAPPKPKPEKLREKTVSRPPAKKEKPEPKSVAEKQPVEQTKEPTQKNTPEKEPAQVAGEIRVTPSPKEKEVIRLAKKTPAETAPIVPVPPRPPPATVATPEISTSVDAGNLGGDAIIEGEISFGATRHYFGEYLLKMKQAIETQWISQLVSRYTGIAMSTAAIDFKIQPDGTATNIVIHSNEGDPYFPIICISAIRDAQPFEVIPYDDIRGLPEEFKDKPLNIRFTFRYN
jgi:outer membrane biosynthesis protein TonB